MSKVTIKDVARVAGVAVSTASYALNKQGEVTWENHKRIIEIANLLGYVPNATARSLAKKRTNTIALITPRALGYNIRDPFYVDLFLVFSEVLAQRGYWMSLYMCSDPNGDELDFMLKSAQVDGVVWVGSSFPKNKRRILRLRKIPYVTFLTDSLGDEDSKLTVDSTFGTRQAIDYLYEQGHRKILCCASYEHRNSVRMATYLSRLKELGLSYQKVIYGHYDFTYAYNAMKEFLRSGEEIPTAVFSCSDDMALGVIQALKENGYKIPNEMSVVGYDDIYEAKHADPPLTTVRQGIDEIAKTICDYLVQEREAGSDIEGMDVVVESHLVVRDSVSIPRSN